MWKVATRPPAGTRRSMWSASGRLKHTYSGRSPASMAAVYSASASWVLPLPAVPTTRRRNGENSRRRAQVARPPDRRVTIFTAEPIMALGSGRRLRVSPRKRVTLSKSSVFSVSGSASRMVWARRPLRVESMMWAGSMPARCGSRTM